MKLPVDFSDEAAIRAAFSYQTRIGLAPKFGTCSIAFYQGEQCRTLKDLETMIGGPGEIRTRAGWIEYRRVVEKRPDGAVYTGWNRLCTIKGYQRFGRSAIAMRA